MSQYTQRAADVINAAVKISTDKRHEFVTPLHLLSAMLDDFDFMANAVDYCYAEQLAEKVRQQLDSMERIPDDFDYHPEPSVQLSQLLQAAAQQVTYSSAQAVDITHLTSALLEQNDSEANYLLRNSLLPSESAESFMSGLIGWYEHLDHVNSVDDDDFNFPSQSEDLWRRLVTCLNDTVQQKNPLIGREKELERTIQVLCRKEKNNPLHVGEPGVGKTALVYGLAARIESGNVPERLKGTKIYQLDLGTMLAGTQFRGEFEKRIKQVMDGVIAEAKKRIDDGQAHGANIVYIDEIHNLVGAGATSDGSMDASNMLKPYLESGDVRFIGSTTYEEYNRHFARSKGLVRRFQQIDILEPSVEETIHILQQLRPRYEEFHGVVYEDSALETAATTSAKHVADRFLPDKAIDLIDEAGAAMQLKGGDESGVRVVDKQLVLDILAKTCKVDTLAVGDDDDNSRLQSLEENMKQQIYGQDEAITQVVQAVQMGKAGLTDDDKPLASLLFVGPTGVGKTEVAHQLARQLGIELLRFDMSEYTEKHTVAKLIGSPAGYVGYEDGGLLTDAIRRAPQCVLLLDEIEKAHQDIYNILLQVMDYARLTDNKGRKADFRNVVLIMTSNAGAQFASQASVGFGQRVERGEAMLRQVKKTFKPEFINRLSATVVFHDMDQHMAELILRKKIGELQAKLAAKKVELTLTDAAFNQLLSESFTHEYGAREMDRVIARRLKPLLMREILFGSLKQGGSITIDKKDLV